MNAPLKPCPCGKTPTALLIVDGPTSRDAYVHGACCGMWEIEFRKGFRRNDSPETMALAVLAWNDAPRAGE